MIVDQNFLDVQVGVLGAMLIDPDCIGSVMQEIRASDFTSASYRMIFEAIRNMFNANAPIDAMTVGEKLGKDYIGTLAQIIDITPTSANVGAYTKLLRERSRLFQLRSIGEEVAAADDEQTVRGLLDKAQELLVEMRSVECVNMHDALLSFFERHDSKTPPKYLNWKFSKVNDLLRIHERDFVVLGGYPSDGKTTLALTFAFEQAKTKKVGFFSYETDTDKLFDRLMSFAAMVELPKMQLNALSENDWGAVHGVEKYVLSTDLDLIIASGMTVSDVRALSASRHYDVIYIDYLQKIPPPDGMIDAYNEFARVSAVSSALQNLAKQTGVTVVALSQLRRRDRTGGKLVPPTMSDLRSSGQIEQDADAIMLLFREDLEAEKTPRVLNIVKNKDGEANRAVSLDFDGVFQSFSQGRREPNLPKPKPKAQQEFSLLPDYDKTPLPAEFMEEKQS